MSFTFTILLQARIPWAVRTVFDDSTGRLLHPLEQYVRPFQPRGSAQGILNNGRALTTMANPLQRTAP